MKLNDISILKATSVTLLSLLSVAQLFAQGSERGAAQPPLHQADFSVFSETDTMDLFLLVGQSNMKGRGAIVMQPTTHPRNLFFHSKKEQWFVSRDPLHAYGTPDLIDGSDNAGTGPAMSYAMTLLEQDPDLAIGLVPAAVGGARISLYKEGGKLYERSLMLLKEAQVQAPLKAEVKAILWLQGESDSTEEGYLSYEQKLLDLVDRYRADLNNPELPFIACTIGSFLHPHRKFTRTREINEILMSLPSKRKYTACVDARDLSGHIGDKVHYSKEAQVEIGKRFAAAYLKLTATELNQEID
ncbi:MAG: sialate O-acetylesterase [Coraliomargarita sp.]